MKGKLFVIVLLGCMLSFGQFVGTKAIQPEVATTIALEQFADPSIQTDTASRMLDIVPTMVAGVWFIYIAGSLYWLKPNIVSLVDRISKKDERNEEV